MSSIKLTADSGGGTFELKAPSSGSNARVLTLPDSSSGTILTTTNPKSGNILQVVQVTKTDHFTSTSTSYADVTGLAASITPTSADSDIIVRFDVQIGGSSNLYASGKCQRLIAGGSYADLQIGDTVGQHRRANISMDTEVSYGYVKGYSNSFSLKDSSHNTTSQITYKLVCIVSAGTIYINRYHNDSGNSTAGTSSVTLMEVAA